MWMPDCYRSFHVDWDFPEPHTKKISPFNNNDPYSNPMKSGRFGAKRKPKQKMSKHRQRIKQMKSLIGKEGKHEAQKERSLSR